MPSRPLEPGVWHGVQTVHWRHLLPIFFHPYRGYLGLHRRFGPVVRVSRPRGRRPFVFVADAPLAHKILVEYAEPIPRPENFIRTIFQATVGDNIVATRGEVWRRKRDRGTQRLKHSTLAQHHEALLGPCVDQLIAGIRREQQQGDALDLLPHIERYTLSAAMSLVSQTEVDPTSSAFEELLTAMRFIMSTTQHIADIRKQMFLFAAIPKARDYVDQGRYRSLKSAVETVAAFEPEPEARELFMAAYENPSTSLTWAMALLAQDARAQDALRREARQSLPHPLPYATATAHADNGDRSHRTATPGSRTWAIASSAKTDACAMSR